MVKFETVLQHYVPVETQPLIKGFTVCMASFDLLLLTLEKCSGSLTPLDHLTFETLPVRCPPLLPSLWLVGYVVFLQSQLFIVLVEAHCTSIQNLE